MRPVARIRSARTGGLNFLFADQVATLHDLGCVAGQGFLLANSSSLEVVAATPYMTRRARLRAARAAHADLTATGRFRTADLWARSAAD